MIAALVRNPRLLFIATALLVALGLSSLAAMPRLEDPRIPNRVGIVLTPYPGASAARVEALVTERIELTLQQLPELKKLTSESRDGLSIVVMELADDVYPPVIDTVWSRARDRLGEVRAELPPGAGAPRLEDRAGHAFTVLVGLSWQGAGEPAPGTLGRYARELENRLWSVPDTEYIEAVGRPREEVRVSIDAARAAATGLGFAAISRIVGEADAKLATGRVSGASVQSTVELAGEFDSLQRIRNAPLATLPDGRQMRVGDIATVERAVQDPLAEVALIDGKPGIVVGSRMGSARRIGDWTADVERTVADLQAVLPANVKLELLFSQNEYTAARMDTLAANLWSGLALVIAVLPFCMGWRSSVVVALSIPLMTGFTLICMRYAGMNLNQMSVCGIILALGIMCDNAIVMADAVVAARRAGQAALEAAAGAVRRLWVPLLGGTLTTVLGFMPAVLMDGPAAEFPGAVAKTVVFSLVGSLAITLTLVAAVVALWERGAAGTALPWFESGIPVPRIAAAFARSLRAALARPRRALLLLLALPLAGLLGAPLLNQQFFPPADRDMLYIEVYLPESASIEATRTVALGMDRKLRGEPGITRMHWFVGRSAPAHFYSLLRRHDGMQNYAQGMLRVSDVETGRALVPRLQRELDAAFPEAQVLVRELVQGPPYDAPVELRLSGPDLQVLRAKGEQLRLLALADPDVIHVRSTLGEAIPRTVVTLPEELVRRSGLSLAEASRQLAAALGGVEQGSITEGTEDVPVRVRVASGERRGSADLAALQFVLGVPPEPGRYNGIPLDAIGTVSLEPGRAAIPRRDGQRENGIEIYPRAGVLAQPLLERLQETIAEQGIELPPGYRLEVGGEWEQQRMASALLMAHVPEIAVLLCAVVVISFRSFRMGALAIGIGLASILLGLLVIEITRVPFGFVTVFALMSLMGLTVNAGVVLLAELQDDPACHAGDPASLVDATLRCGRHVTGTSATTVLGLAPLVTSDNAFFSYMAQPVAGGTLLATVMFMYLIPVVYMLYARRRAM